MDANKVLFAKFPDDVSSMDGNKKYLVIKSEWISDTLKLSIYQSATNSSFKGQLTVDKIRETAEELVWSYDELLSECKAALTDRASEFGAYLYKIDAGVFSLRKVMTKCTVDLMEIVLVPESCNDTILDAALERITQLEKYVKAIGSGSDTHSADYAELLHAHKKVLSEQEAAKIELTKKFALLINTKKQQVLELRQQNPCVHCHGAKMKKGDATSGVNDGSSNGKAKPTVEGATDEGGFSAFAAAGQRIMAMSCEIDNTEDLHEKHLLEMNFGKFIFTTTDEIAEISKEQLALAAPENKRSYNSAYLRNETLSDEAMEALRPFEEACDVLISITTEYAKATKVSAKRRLETKLNDYVQTKREKMAALYGKRVILNPTIIGWNTIGEPDLEDIFCDATQPFNPTDMEYDDAPSTSGLQGKRCGY